MDFAVRESVITPWLGHLPDCEGRDRLGLLTLLAWHLRQRDTRQAVAYADEADALSDNLNLPPAELHRMHGRLALVRGEAAWLFADLGAAQRCTDAAEQAFQGAADPIGLADSHWLRAWIAAERGNVGERDRQFQQAADWAVQGGDDTRQWLALAGLARSAVFADVRGAVTRWGDRMLAQDALDDPVRATWALDFRYLVASKRQDVGRAVGHAIQMFSVARDTGQIHRAITAASNTGFDLTRINDHQAALEWMQRGLDLARAAGWPASIGMCLTETAETLRQLKQPSAARELLAEALQILAPFSQGRWVALALNYLGDVELDSGRFDAALETFEALRERALRLNQADLVSIALRGQAHALSRLGHPREALVAADEALELAREQRDSYNEMSALRVIADVHFHHPAHAHGNGDHHAQALAHLQRALDAAGRIEGYTVPAEMHETLAREYAHIGDYEAAYRALLKGQEARERIHTEQATNLAVSLQIRHETDRVRDLADHHRQLAEAETARAKALQETGDTLEHLADVGRELTAHLDEGAILHTLNRRVDAMLDATCLAVYLFDEHSGELVSTLFREHGQAMPVDRIPVDSPVRHAARCFRECRELVLGQPDADGDPSQVPGTLTTLSALFVPLVAGDRTLGVASVQSLREDAYGERELLIFRHLCAYAAIALYNADTYLRLASTELNLRESQKRYARVVDNIGDALAMFDRDGQVVGYANPRFQQLFGLAASATPGVSLAHRVVLEHVPVFDAAWAEALSGRASDTIEFEVLRGAGERIWVDARFTPIMDDAMVEGVQASLRDISVRKRAEAEVVRNLQRERELVQLKSRFVSMTSHEFRTPLAGMSTSIELLRHYSDRMDANERDEVFKTMQESIERMTSMLDDVLVIGQGEARSLKFTPAPVALAKLCREIADEAERSRKARGFSASLNIDIGELPDQLSMDAGLLRHILANLLSNAFKYSPAGGEVRFEVRAGMGQAHITVSDQGIGIPLEDQPRLFESFHRAGNVGGISGTGLGLAIVKQSVDLHGGKIRVDSAPGQGTRFHVLLPAPVVQ